MIRQTVFCVGLRRRFFCTPSNSPNNQNKWSDTWDRSKKVMKSYGPVAFVFHASTYVVTLAGLYAGVSAEMIPVNTILPAIHSGMAYAGLDSVIGDDGVDAGSKFAAAWVLAKFSEPLRIPLTVYCTPKIARAIGLKLP